MRVSIHRPTRTRTAVRPRRLGHTVVARTGAGQIPEPAVVIAARQAVGSDQRRARRAGGPLDLALYSCGCGVTFQAPVSAGVSCPRCGDDQAW